MMSAENQYLVSVPFTDEASMLLLQLQDSLTLAPSREGGNEASGICDIALSVIEIIVEESQSGREPFLLRLKASLDQNDIYSVLDVDPLIITVIDLPIESKPHARDIWIPASVFDNCREWYVMFRCANVEQFILTALFVLAKVVRAIQNGKSFCTASVVSLPMGQTIKPLCIKDVRVFEVTFREGFEPPRLPLPPIDIMLSPRTHVMLRELETYFNASGATDTMTYVLLSVGDLVDTWKLDIHESFMRDWFAAITAREIYEARVQHIRDGHETGVILRLDFLVADRVTLALIASFLEIPQSDILFTRIIACAYYQMLMIEHKLPDRFPSPVP